MLVHFSNMEFHQKRQFIVFSIKLQKKNYDDILIAHHWKSVLQAVLVGDFILARATQVLCSIGKPSVISVMATIIEDLVKGEFMQMNDGTDLNATQRFNKYMAKTYSKTASLFANSCRSAAMLSGQ